MFATRGCLPFSLNEGTPNHRLSVWRPPLPAHSIGRSVKAKLGGIKGSTSDVINLAGITRVWKTYVIWKIIGTQQNMAGADLGYEVPQTFWREHNRIAIQLLLE